MPESLFTLLAVAGWCSCTWAKNRPSRISPSWPLLMLSIFSDASHASASAYSSVNSSESGANMESSSDDILNKIITAEWKYFVPPKHFNEHLLPYAHPIRRARAEQQVPKRPRLYDLRRARLPARRATALPPRRLPVLQAVLFRHRGGGSLNNLFCANSKKVCVERNSQKEILD